MRFTKLENIVKKFAGKYLDARLVFVADVLLSLFGSFVVWGLTVLTSNSPTYYLRDISLIWIAGSIVGSVVSFWFLKTYTIIIRHTTFKDVLRFALSALLKALLLLLIIHIFKPDFVRTIFLMLVLDVLITSFILLGVRLAMIAIYDMYRSRLREMQQVRRSLVFGASDKALAVITRLKLSKHYDIVGILSSDSNFKGATVFDTHAYYFGNEEDFIDIVNKFSIQTIIFPLESDVREQAEGVVRWCGNLGVQVLVVPVIGGDKLTTREIKIEDLLGRDEIQISEDEISRVFAGKTVMVTGAAGSIGSELCRQLACLGVGKLVLYDNAETPMHNLRLELEERFPELNFVPIIGDVRLHPRLDFAFRTHRPQVVFHAAAYKHVPLMEENPCEAVLVNVAGSRNLADKCIEYDVEKMVMISTDKAVNPTNIMGCTKRLAEIYVQSLGLAIENGTVKGRTKFVTTRFGNVLGSNGSVIPRFREQIAKGGPVTVTHPDITRFFMTIPEACRLVMEAVILPTENHICVFDMGTPVKIDTLARRMIELSGLKPDEDINIVYSGLRPGEKLYEEVLSNVENTDPTRHDRIRIARVRQYDYNDALKAANDLETLSRRVDIPEMVKYMKRIVPEYISNNSKFSEYDKKQD